ncbi:MAG: hypothetical protein HGB22_00430 [Chlorobiaceae bacterium]|nr:hypothetical protein [Chlorobiaceae bacterium]
MQTIYADGIANMILVDGVVRVDLVNITQIEEGNTNVRPVGTLAFSVPALIRTHDQLTKMIDKMVEDGILTRNDPKDN